MSDILKLSRSQADQIIEQAREGDPLEICGMMGGSGSSVKKIFPTENVDDSQVTYQIDPSEQFKIMRTLREEKLELVGIYHSHPETEAYPSPTDKKLAFYPESFYVIISLADKDDPVIRAFRIIDDVVTEAEVEISAG